MSKANAFTSEADISCSGPSTK